jgi:uncharacterized protein with HEPN domain
MSQHQDELYLRHIREAISKAMAWARVPQETFMTDEFRQSAVIRQLEIAGEAAGRLSQAFRQAHPTIEAREMKALRNVLIHSYADIDLETVWEIIQNDLPRLRDYLNQLDRNQATELGD